MKITAPKNMKKSTLYLSAFTAFIFILITLFMVQSKYLLKKQLDNAGIEYDFEDEVDWSEEFSADLSDYDSIDIEGKLRLIVRRGDSYSARIQIKNDPELDLDVRRGTLHIRTDERGKSKTKIELTLPQLQSVKLEGAFSFEMHGFEEEEMELDLQGAYSVEADDCSFKSFRVHSEGIGSLDLKNAPARNLDLTILGVNSADFRIRGGSLKVHAEGMGVVNVAGPHSDIDITRDGLIGINTD